MLMKKVKMKTIHMKVLFHMHTYYYVPFNLHYCKGLLHEHYILSWFHVNVLWQYKKYSIHVW
jgi:hypothetical protein